jgi:hypothetical protein
MKGTWVGCSEKDDKCWIITEQMKNYRAPKEEYIPKSWTSINDILEVYRCTTAANLATERTEIS